MFVRKGHWHCDRRHEDDGEEENAETRLQVPQKQVEKRMLWHPLVLPRTSGSGNNFPASRLVPHPDIVSGVADDYANASFRAAARALPVPLQTWHARGV